MKIIPNMSMPNMQPVTNAAKSAGNAVVAGAKETGRVAVQTSRATTALVTMVALAVLTAIASPLYFISNKRFEVLTGETVNAFQNFKAQTRAIVHNPANQAPAAAPQSRTEAIVARLSAAASSVKANKGKAAVAAFVAVAGAALYYNGVPAVVSQTVSRAANYFFPAIVGKEAEAEEVCQLLAQAGKVCTVKQFGQIQQAFMNNEVISAAVSKIVA